MFINYIHNSSSVNRLLINRKTKQTVMLHLWLINYLVYTLKIWKMPQNNNEIWKAGKKILLIRYVPNSLLNSVGITYSWTSQKWYLIKQSLVKYILKEQTVLYTCHDVEDWKPTSVTYEGAAWFHPRSKFPH